MVRELEYNSCPIKMLGIAIIYCIAENFCGLKILWSDENKGVNLLYSLHVSLFADYLLYTHTHWR